MNTKYIFMPGHNTSTGMKLGLGPLYTKGDHKRSDWGLLSQRLASGQTVTIEPATKEEQDTIIAKQLEKLRKRNGSHI